MSGTEASNSDSEIVRRVRLGDVEAFEELVRKYKTRVFAMVRRYARREHEVEDIVQDVFIKAYSKLNSWRADAPFEHWLMRISVRICYDYLRYCQRNRELPVTDLSEDESDWLERQAAGAPGGDAPQAAQTLVSKVLAQMSPANRLIITLLEIEERPVKEIANITGWSVSLVKVRAFRARAEMKRLIQQISLTKYL
jgi:RNA polymerase sigma-70 factor, ECF subfamily